MNSEGNEVFKFSASRAIASIWGVLAGIGGLTHGIGEMFQGSVAPGGLIFNSWAQGPIATHMGGEPAMSIVPNLVITGALTVLISVAILGWAILFVQRRNGGRVMMFLSVALLLVGGGFGPPLVGIIAGWAGTGINSPLSWWRRRLPVTVWRLLVIVWPWLFIVCLAASALLFIGSIFLVYFFDVNNADFFLNLFFFVIGSLLLTVVTGFARDIPKQAHGMAA